MCFDVASSVSDFDVPGFARVFIRCRVYFRSSFERKAGCSFGSCYWIVCFIFWRLYEKRGHNKKLFLWLTFICIGGSEVLGAVLGPLLSSCASLSEASLTAASAALLVQNCSLIFPKYEFFVFNFVCLFVCCFLFVVCCLLFVVCWFFVCCFVFWFVCLFYFCLLQNRCKEKAVIICPFISASPLCSSHVVRDKEKETQILLIVFFLNSEKLSSLTHPVTASPTAGKKGSALEKASGPQKIVRRASKLFGRRGSFIGLDRVECF